MTLILLQAFSPIDFVQTYTVPAGMHSLYIKAHGGDGGRGAFSAPYPLSGSQPSGRGQRFQGDLPVTPGEVLTLYVGRRGGFPGVHTSGEVLGGWPDGGNSGSGDGVNRGCGGGGSTRIYRGFTPLLICGGGGGLRGVPAGSLNTLVGDANRPGFTAFTGTPAVGTGGGAGGSPTSGGAGGVFSTSNGFPGSFLQGGKGAAGTTDGLATTADIVSGGGGGGGYYGGGGGANGLISVASGGTKSGGGGGGSSYILNSAWATQAWVPNLTGVVVEANTPDGIVFETGFNGFIEIYAESGKNGWALGLNKFMG